MAAPIMLHSHKIQDVDLSQVIRYVGMSNTSITDSVSDMIERCKPKLIDTLNLKACYLEVPVTICDNTVSFEYMEIKSNNLSKLLKGCDKAILVAATAGIQTDLLVKQSEITSKAEALIYNSIAIAAIEQYMGVLNSFFKEQYAEYELRPRYSPGYGDVPLETQKDLLCVLDANRKIGVSLSSSLLMTPAKSVTAIIGLGRDGCVHIDRDCDLCSKRDCEYRLT